MGSRRLVDGDSNRKYIHLIIAHLIDGNVATVHHLDHRYDGYSLHWWWNIGLGADYEATGNCDVCKFNDRSTGLQTWH